MTSSVIIKDHILRFLTTVDILRQTVTLLKSQKSFLGAYKNVRQPYYSSFANMSKFLKICLKNGGKCFENRPHLLKRLPKYLFTLGIITYQNNTFFEHRFSVIAFNPVET